MKTRDHKIKAPDFGYFGNLFPQIVESWTISLSLFWSIVVCIKSNMFDIFHHCDQSTFALTHQCHSLRLPGASLDPNFLHNPLLSEAPWDS